MSSFTFGVKCGQSPHERSRLCRYHSSRRDSHHSSEHSDCVAPGQGCRRGRTHVQLMKVSWSSIVVKTLSACRCVAISDNVVVSTPAILMLAACRRSQPDSAEFTPRSRCVHRRDAAPRGRRRQAVPASAQVATVRLDLGPRSPIFGQKCHHFCPTTTSKRLDFWASDLRQALGMHLD